MKDINHVNIKSSKKGKCLLNNFRSTVYFPVSNINIVGIVKYEIISPAHFLWCTGRAFGVRQRYASLARTVGASQTVRDSWGLKAPTRPPLDWLVPGQTLLTVKANSMGLTGWSILLATYKFGNVQLNIPHPRFLQVSEQLLNKCSNTWRNQGCQIFFCWCRILIWT